MKPGLRRARPVVHRAVVRPWMRPRLDGLVRHRMYSSWAMIYHMEVASRKLLAPFLEADEEAVGASMRLDHLGPAAIGEKLKIKCSLDRVKKNKIIARLEIFAGARKIGTGSHVQAVMSKDKFARLLRPAVSR